MKKALLQINSYETLDKTTANRTSYNFISILKPFMYCIMNTSIKESSPKEFSNDRCNRECKCHEYVLCP